VNVVVYTASIGTAETPPAPRVIDAKTRYVCITDRPLALTGWERMSVGAGGNPRRTARRVKALSHRLFPTADVAIWIDASFELQVLPHVLVNDMMTTGCVLAGLRHPDRRRITEEAQVVSEQRMAKADDVARQLSTYQHDKFDTPNAPQGVLTTTGLLVRTHTPRVKEFNERWWHEMKAHTLRDQLSIDYCAFKLELSIGYLFGHYRSNPYARYDRLSHRRQRAPETIGEIR
jgi:hypothetical protein